MKKVGIGLAAGVALALVAVFAFQKSIGLWLFQRGMEQNVTRDMIAGLEDGLHVGLCGTGSPMPNPKRAGPCNVVIAGKRIFIVDIGEGAARNVALMGIDPANIDSLLLTHFHSDHIDGLGPLMLNYWVRGAHTAPLPVHGPRGVGAVTAGFTAAYSIDDRYRTAHHGEAVAPSSGGGADAQPFDISSDTAVVLKGEGLVITAFKVDHGPVKPAVGYRFDYKGRSLCISGDTARSANLERTCKGVDILVHEALQPPLVKDMQHALEAQGNTRMAKIMGDIQTYHTSPSDAARSAEQSEAKMLVLTHLIPPLPNSYLYPAFLGDAEHLFDGSIVVGEDGMTFSLPANSGAIERSKWL